MKVRTETRRPLPHITPLSITYLARRSYATDDASRVVEPLTQLFPFNLRADVTRMAAFVVSVLAFFFLQLTPNEEEKRQWNVSVLESDAIVCDFQPKFPVEQLYHESTAHLI